MKNQNWTYKKLGEISSFRRGLTYSKKDEVSSSTKQVLRANNIELDTHTLNFEDIKCIDENFDIAEDKKLKANTIFICMSSGSMQHLGKVAFVDRDYDYAFGGFMGLIVPNADEIHSKYLFYSFLSSRFQTIIHKEGKGININNLKFSDLSDFSIPAPPLPTQRAIVAELDTLNEILDKKRQQLKELDTLAQSIFYDMFGDPVENEKGWEVKRLGEVCTVTSSKRVYQTEWKNYGIPFLRISDFTQLIEDTTIDTELFISMEKYKELNVLGQVPKSGDILVTSRGTLGNCYIINDNDRFYFQDGMITWLKDINKQIHPLLIKFLFKNNSFRKQIDKSQNGSTVAYLSISMLKKFRIPLPPLSLQQSFAQKIEAIEKQKNLINASIKEMETLFNATMDKYFG